MGEEYTRSLIPAQIINIQNPVINLSEPVVFALHRSGDELVYNINRSGSWSQVDASWNIDLNSMTDVLDRAIYLRIEVQVDFAGTAPVGQNLLQTGFDAFRAFPLQAIMEDLRITINGTSWNQNQRKYVPYLQRICGFNNVLEYSMSTAPHYLDASQTYDQLTNTNRNPLGGYAEAPAGTATARGGFPMKVLSNTNTSASITATITEPLMITPLIWADMMKKGLSGINRVTIDITWAASMASRIWSHSNAGGSVFTSPPSVTLGQPQLLTRTVRPQKVYMNRVPRQLLYEYNQLRIYPTSTNTVLGPGLEDEITMNNIQLSTVPDTIILFLRKRDQDLTYLDTDTFAAIKAVNILWGTKTGVLAGASQQDLYQVARRNGVALSWESWSGETISTMLGSSTTTLAGVGGILPLKVGADIPVDADESAGVSKRTQVTVTIKYQNVSPNPINFDAFVVALDKGTWSVMDGMSAYQVGVVSARAAQEAPDVNPTFTYQTSSSMHEGGNFFGDLWGGLKKIGNFVGDEVIPMASKIVGPAIGVYKTITGRGFEDDDNMSVRSMSSVGSAQSVSGGKLVPHNTLKKRLGRI